MLRTPYHSVAALFRWEKRFLMHAPAVIVPLTRFVGTGLVTALLAASPLLAQNAELSGLISDPSSLAVANARVVVQSADNAATRSVVSNQQGEYSVPALQPGTYEVTVEANGFKTIRQSGVVVEVDQRARLDFALTVGSAADTPTGATVRIGRPPRRS